MIPQFPATYNNWMQFSRHGSSVILCIILTAVFSIPPVLAQSPVQEPRNPKSEPPATEPATDRAKVNSVENSVVKVFTTARRPDPYKPWTKQAPSEATGSGVVIEGKRILTNAHVIQYASQVQVQASQAGDKISATVESFAPGIDLAVLKLDDEKFFDSHPPLPRASTLPEIKDAVMVYGYPTGGDNMSITKGIVSRIDFATYNYPVSGLRIQIDAAINPGNSGGPAVAGDKMVGLAFSHLVNAQNIGYIIPCEEIELFLKDIASGHYHGKPAFYDDYQTLENPALRSYLKLPKTAEGIIIHKPFSSSAGYPLKEWDVITKIGDSPVDDQGMVRIANNTRVNFRYLVQKIARQDKIPLTIIRSGKEMQVSLPVSADYPLVIPSLSGAYPSYFIYGPVVFSNATMEFTGGYTKAGGVSASGLMGFVGSPLVRRMLEKPAFPNEQLVVVASPFFPHKLSEGYGNPMSKVLKSVNGIPIKNLNHLVEVLRNSKDEFLMFEFDTRFYETLIFKRTEIMAATEEILTDNGIRSQGSPDVLEIWNASPGR